MIQRIKATKEEVDQVEEQGVCHVQIEEGTWMMDTLDITFLDGPFKGRTTEINIEEIEE